MPEQLHDKQSVLPSVTIIMPSHNRADRLEKALQAISAQVYPLELVDLVLVLDGCSDGSSEVVEKLKPTLPFKITVISQPQGGPARARNVGVRMASGNILLFIDDDVVASPQLITEHITFHLRDEKAVVLGTMSPPPAHQRPIWVRWEEQILLKQYADMLAGKYKPTARQFYTGNSSVARQWFLSTGEFDETFLRAEDIEFAYRMQSKFNLNFYFDPQAIGYHYANRSFASWKRAHYLYGRYDVIMDRDKGHNWIIPNIRNEFKRRDHITRFLAINLLNRRRSQNLLSKFIWVNAQLTSRIGLSAIAYKSLSGLANVLYWQGLHDELNVGKVAEKKASTPMEAHS